MLVPFRLDKNIENLALGIDGAPQIDHAAIDLEIDLIQMPARVGLRSAFTQVRCDHRPEIDDPARLRAPILGLAPMAQSASVALYVALHPAGRCPRRFKDFARADARGDLDPRVASLTGLARGGRLSEPIGTRQWQRECARF